MGPWRDAWTNLDPIRYGTSFKKLDMETGYRRKFDNVDFTFFTRFRPFGIELKILFSVKIWVPENVMFDVTKNPTGFPQKKIFRSITNGLNRLKKNHETGDAVRGFHFFHKWMLKLWIWLKLVNSSLQGPIHHNKHQFEYSPFSTEV